MTSNQIDYWKMKESSRHNLATEEQARNELGENRRHNLRAESLSNKDISERIRHDVVSEGISRGDLAEKIRHDVRQEQLSQFSNQTGRISALAQWRNANSQALQAQAALERNDLNRLEQVNALRTQGFAVNDDGTLRRSASGIITNAFYTAWGRVIGHNGIGSVLSGAGSIINAIK